MFSEKALVHCFGEYHNIAKKEQFFKVTNFTKTGDVVSCITQPIYDCEKRVLNIVRTTLVMDELHNLVCDSNGEALSYLYSTKVKSKETVAVCAFDQIENWIRNAFPTDYQRIFDELESTTKYFENLSKAVIDLESGYIDIPGILYMDFDINNREYFYIEKTDKNGYTECFSSEEFEKYRNTKVEFKELFEKFSKLIKSLED